jgi:hypothetical protein
MLLVPVSFIPSISIPFRSFLFPFILAVAFTIQSQRNVS